MKIEVGNIVPLKASIECPDIALFVRAFIKDKDNTLLATKDLTETSTNTFTNYTFLMPNTELVEVEYILYIDAGYTIVATDFCPDTDIFIGTRFGVPDGAIFSASIEVTGEMTAVIAAAPELVASINVQN